MAMKKIHLGGKLCPPNIADSPSVNTVRLHFLTPLLKFDMTMGPQLNRKNGMGLFQMEAFAASTQLNQSQVRIWIVFFVLFHFFKTSFLCMCFERLVSRAYID